MFCGSVVCRCINITFSELLNLFKYYFSQLQGIKWKRLRTGYEGEKENFPDQQFASKIYLR